MKVGVLGNTRIFAVHPHAMEPYMGSFGKYLSHANGFENGIAADGPVTQILEDQEERQGVKYYTVTGDKKDDVQQLNKSEVESLKGFAVGNNARNNTVSEVTGL